MKVYLAADVTYNSVVDGPGIRNVIWTQGCRHKCPGCHNPQTHEFLKDKSIETDELAKELILSGFPVTLSGGDPFYQSVACAELAKKLKAAGLNIWAYTGFTFEELLNRNCCLELLALCDRIVDGPFIIAKKDITLSFRGSSNQRIIKCRESIKSGKVIIDEKYNTISPQVDSSIFI